MNSAALFLDTKPVTNSLLLFRPHARMKAIELAGSLKPESFKPGTGARSRRNPIWAVAVLACGLLVLVCLGVSTHVLSSKSDVAEVSSEPDSTSATSQNRECTPNTKQSPEATEVIEIGGLRHYVAEANESWCNLKFAIVEMLDEQDTWKKLGVTEVTPNQ